MAWHWANRRRANGHAEPYAVRYWGLGNEMYGGWQIGSLSAEDYVKKAKTLALVMKRTDPSIELIGCGHNGWSDWDAIVLEGLAPIVGYHSIHLYTGQPDLRSVSTTDARAVWLNGSLVKWPRAPPSATGCRSVNSAG